MARRDRSSSSRSSSAAKRPSSSSTTRAAGRPRSDGKVDIFCPQCAAQYRIAEDAIDIKVACTQCQRVFFPKAGATKRPKAKDYSKAYIGFGVGAVLIVGTLVLMSRGGDQPKPKAAAPTNTADAQLQIDRKARADQGMRWARAVATGDLLTLRTYSDLAAMATVLGIDATLVGDARDQAIVAALPKHDATRLFSEMECSSADVSESAVKAGAGAMTFYFSNKPGDTVYDPKAGAQVTVQWSLQASQMRVASFEVTAKPVVRGKRPGDSSNTFKPSEEVAKPKLVETNRGGALVKVKESDPAPIAHLADTPEPVREKIDALVKDLIASADPDSPGYLFGRSSSALKAIGKPAMPRLVNALYELYPDVQGNNQKISQVTRCLLDMTGMAFAYDVRGSGDAAKDKPARESVIRQWFAWWWRFANDTYQDAIDQSEDLLDASSSKPKDK